MSPSLFDNRVIIVCGTGGVGKTTISASLAIGAALLGKRALVLTIDPAKRLADALGKSQSVGDSPIDLTSELGPSIQGTLHASMPDTRATLEGFMHSLTQSEALIAQILRNPIFQIFAKEFSGANEYMALHRLASVVDSELYDTIILDTPPSQNSLAFLEAPTLLSRLFDEKIIQWLSPAGSWMAAGMKKAMSLLETLTGTGFIQNLFEFFYALFEVRIAFSARLKRVTEIMKADSTGFIVVSSPASFVQNDMFEFSNQVQKRGYRYQGLLLNRSIGELDLEPLRSAGEEEPLALLQSIQVQEKARIQEIRSEKYSKGHPIHAIVPELRSDIHSLGDLVHVAHFILNALKR
jgi:anion-transporting  ArsA/GET3 family ATPase